MSSKHEEKIWGAVTAVLIIASIVGAALLVLA
jgi:hypothetical protein